MKIYNTWKIKQGAYIGDTVLLKSVEKCNKKYIFFFPQRDLKNKVLICAFMVMKKLFYIHMLVIALFFHLWSTVESLSIQNYKEITYRVFGFMIFIKKA